MMLQRRRAGCRPAPPPDRGCLTVPRPVVAVNSYAPSNQQAGTGDGRVQNDMLVEAALSDGHWLLFASPLVPPPAVDPVATKFSRASFTAWLALSIALGILLSMLAAQRLPISKRRCSPIWTLCAT